MSNLLPYQISEDESVDLSFIDDTIWITQKGMAMLFDCSTDNIALHLKNIFKDNELDQKAVTEEY
ncbi:hypothetical protein BTV99_12860, partial [Psychrobacter sp. Rd 27.2]